MPYTAKQKRFFGAELGRLEEGKGTKTGMSKAQLVEGIHSKTRKKKARSEGQKEGLKHA
jgi:hypothetical protein